MRVAIIGDSFLQYVRDTWIEDIAREFEWNVVHSQGNPGGCEYFTYEELNKIIDKVDLVMFSHTEPHRLVNPLRKGITPIVATTDYKSDVPDDMRDAAKAYYNHLYHEPFHGTVHELLIGRMQDMCYLKNVKQVHLQSFVYPVPKTHGLWIEGSLHDIAALQGNDYYKDFSLRNHFSRSLHDRFYQWLRLHLRYYLNNDLDHHSVLMGTEEFR